MLIALYVPTTYLAVPEQLTGCSCLHGRSDDWPPLVRLKKIREDAEAAQSKRAQELNDIFRDIRMTLGLGHDKTSVSTRKRERRPRMAAQGPAESSDELGQESHHQQKPKRLRRKHPGPVATSSAEAATPRTGTDDSWAPECLPKLKRIAVNFYCLDHILREVPVELRILQAISFDAIDAREDSIEDADAATFRWLLEEPVDQDVEQHMVAARQSLLGWLSKGQGTYHISGKPGSGKSTLFKLIAHHPRTKTELSHWAGEKELIIASFYFWNSGSARQTSYEGLQRSVLVQILRQVPEAIQKFFPDAWDNVLKSKDCGAATSCIDLVGTAQIYEAWSKFWRPSKSMSDPPYRICLFIDGLDEYTETATVKCSTLARAFRLSTYENDYVKICLSSRPYDEILDVLDPEQRLHLHELTSRDIRASATSEILALVKQQGLTDQGKQLVNTIVEKSEGVFVWVKTVLRNIQALVASHARLANDTLVSDASLAALVGDELLGYPPDIDDLYDHLLQRLSLRARSTAALMFALVISNLFVQPPNALWFSWIDELEVDPDFPGVLGFTPYTADQIRIKHQDVRQRLGELTMGLLAMHTDRRERRDGDQFYRQRVQFSHRTARDFFRSPRGRLYLAVLKPSVGKLSGSTSSQRELPNAAAPESHPTYQQSSERGSTASILVPIIKGDAAPLSRWPTAETFARLRLAEMIFAGKYRVAAGADPRRRRIYSNYLRSLLLIRENSMPYQIPFTHLETLRKDLETTHTEAFGSAYVVGTFRSITHLNATEDPEKPASFQHLALAHGQYQYVAEKLKRAQSPADDGSVAKKGKMKKKGNAKRNAQPESMDEPSLILTAVFGGHDGVSGTTKLDTLLPYCDPMAYMTIRPPVSNDFLSDVSLKASIPMVFSSVLVFMLHRTLGGLYRTPTFKTEPFVLLNRLLAIAMEKSNADIAPLNFVFLLEKRKDITSPATKAPAPPSSDAKNPVVLNKRVPEDLRDWITSPMKNASGNLIFGNSVDQPEPIHPCGIAIEEKFHTTLVTLLARFVDDTDLILRLCDRMSRDVSAAVLNEQSEVFKNIVPGDSSLDQFVCTRVVASDGVVIDRDSDLGFRLY